MLIPLLFELAGCSISPAGRAGTHDLWAKSNGGIVAGPDARRADRALFRILAANSCPASIHVISTPVVGAWSWPDGSIYLSRQIVSLLNDDELAAVIAHEMGHFHASGAFPVAALDGACAPDRIEAHADAEACELLSGCGVPTRSLTSALQKVSAVDGTPTPVRVKLEARIKLLNSPLAGR